MPLVNGFDLIDIIKERHVVAGAFNTTNIETTIGILNAVEKSGIPAFIQIAPTNIPVSGYGYIADMVNRYAKKMDTPIALHLDHGKSFDSVRKAARIGFTSVMTDNTKYDYEENIQHTYEVVQFAKGYGIPVEAELGAIAGKEDEDITKDNNKTNPDQVVDFVERTGVNLLAVAVGNVHGLDLNPNIDFPLLKKIYEICPVPLVLHGASGIPDEQIAQMVDNGVVKINVASDLRHAYIQSVGKSYEEDPKRFDLANVSLAAEKAVENVVYHKIQVMNQNSPTPVHQGVKK